MSYFFQIVVHGILTLPLEKYEPYETVVQAYKMGWQAVPIELYAINYQDGATYHTQSYKAYKVSNATQYFHDWSGW